MPTAYTAPILDGCTFEEYAFDTIGALGAAIHQRGSDNTDYLPPEPNGIDEEVALLVDAREAWAEMTSTELAARIEADHRSEVEQFRQRRAKEAENERRLLAMREQVKRFEPPTPDHLQWRQFMLSQIDDTLDFDGRVNTYAKEPTLPEDFEAYRMKQIQSINDQIKRVKENHEADMTRWRNRTEWLKQAKSAIEGFTNT